MPNEPLPDAARALLAAASPAVMATLGRHGQPVTAATWYLLEDDGTILVNLQADRKRMQHLRTDPRVSLTVLGSEQTGSNWYRHLSIQGHVARIADDEGLTGIDRVSTHYTGQPYETRDQPRVSVWIQIDSWYGWHVG